MGPKLVDYLLYEAEDSGIAWIRFNRPERPNALMGNSQENSTVATVGEYMQEKIAGSKLVVIPDSGHLTNLEKPDAFNRAVLDFLRPHRDLAG